MPLEDDANTLRHITRKKNGERIDNSVVDRYIEEQFHELLGVPVGKYYTPERITKI